MSEPKRLTRSRRDRMLGGVCGGIAHYFDMDPTLVRLLWVILSIFPGSVFGGIVVYVVCWIVIPEAPLGSEGPIGGGTPVQAPPGQPPSS